MLRIGYRGSQRDMHEIRVTVPQGQAKQVAEVAHAVGIAEVAVYGVFADGPNQTKETISAQTSTPKAKLFTDRVLSAPWYDAKNSSISSRELRALVMGDDPHEITQPMLEPPINIFEDLWQLNHLTISYMARAISGALLLAYGMLENDPITIVVAALFLPFLSQALAISFGIWSGEFRLTLHGLKCLGFSTIVSVAAGMIVVLMHGGPMRYQMFAPPLTSFLISAVIGVTAGIITADDAGRRYMIGVAAAVQYGIFPVWFGFCLIGGFPNAHIVAVRLGAFAINVGTIALFGLVGYLLLDIKRRDVQGFIRGTGRTTAGE